MLWCGAAAARPACASCEASCRTTSSASSRTPPLSDDPTPYWYRNPIKRRRGRPSACDPTTKRDALPALQLARVRVLAALTVARLTAAARLTALARSRRHGHGTLAAARAFRTGADRAGTNVRLSGHERHFFFLVLTSCQRRKGVSHPGGQSGLDGAAIVVE